MKAVLAILILAIVCLVLFVTGLISPGRSRRMQAKVDRLARKGEAKGESSGGRVGDLTRTGVEKMRNAADASADKGREINRRLSD